MTSAGRQQFSASRLPGAQKASGWASLLPPRAARPALEGHEHFDVVVIGGGFAGLSAATRAAQLDPKLKIAVLEAQAVSDGAAGRNSGFVIDLPHDVSSGDFEGGSSIKSQKDIFVSRAAVEFIRNLAEQHAWGPEVVDARGRYCLAAGKEGDHHLSAYSRQLSNLSETHRALNKSEVHALTGSDFFTSGLFTPGTLILQPADYIRHVADALPDNVTLYENSPVTAFSRQGGGWRVSTAKGAISTEKIILANNGYSECFGIFPRSFLHIYTYASMTRSFEPDRLDGEKIWAATPALPMGTTVRRLFDGKSSRLLIRSHYTYNPDQTLGEKTVRRVGSEHDRSFRLRFPNLRNVDMEYRWGGGMAVTWNTVPAFGEIEQGVFSACGCNGIGAAKSTSAGIAAVELMLGASSKLADLLQDNPPPKRLPPPVFSRIGVPATLAYRRWRSGRE